MSCVGMWNGSGAESDGNETGESEVCLIGRLEDWPSAKYLNSIGRYRMLDINLSLLQIEESKVESGSDA